MTDNKLTDEQVVKRLGIEIEIAEETGDVRGMKVAVELLKNSLNIINRQKSEIDILIRKNETLKDEIAEQQVEIERLQNLIDEKNIINKWLLQELSYEEKVSN